MGVITSMSANLTLIVCLGSTLYMTGVIVFVQVVHYPLFKLVESGAFVRFHDAHVRRTTYVVMVPMIVELITSVTLVFHRPESVPGWLTWAGLFAASLTWVATGLISVPDHDRLSKGFDVDFHRRLVQTNLIRVFAWSAHSLVLLVMTGHALR